LKVAKFWVGEPYSIRIGTTGV